MFVFAFFSAEEINYNVRFPNEVWDNDFADLEDKIKKDVKLCLGCFSILFHGS